LSKPETRRCTQFASDAANGRDLLPIIEARNSPFVRVRLDHIARRIVTTRPSGHDGIEPAKHLLKKYLARTAST